ncbi:MAG: hypothetical protein NTX00_01325 [Candidatus Parcubacteria bacterium]|nr:hypothetical protein [Candidatus Parcubacteria bacterium]
MLRTQDLSDEELRELMSRPLTEKEAESLSKINREAHWLLALNLREMEEEGSIQTIRVKIPRKFRKR